MEVSEQRLAANFRALQMTAGPGMETLAVIKANAYGHGAELCARVLARAGAQWLGVTCAEEGARVRAALREQGVSPRILVMCGGLPRDTELLQAHGLTPVIWTAEHVDWLRAVAPMPVHVEVDTGMGRQGVRPGAELDALLTEMAAAGLVLDGIFTHFASSEVAGAALTQMQQARFAAAVAQVSAHGVGPAWVHAGNSSTLDNPAPPADWLVELAHSVGARAMVRSGLALFGHCLEIEPSAAPPAPCVRPRVLPVMTWKAAVLAVRDLRAGETVGYGATFTAAAPMRVALLPVGYADGLRRELSSATERAGGWVMLHGQRARILGRISMNLTVVDVTSIPAAAPGGEAVLLGEGISAEDHARLAATIPYEILCGIRSR